MVGEWQALTVDQIKASGDRAIAIGPFGSRMKADAYVASGVPVIRGNNISDTRALVGDFVFVSDETADELRSCNVFAGDLVFPHRGAIGQVGIVPEDATPRYMLSTSLMKLTCNRQVVDPMFIFYFFRSPDGRHALLQHASTVGTPGIGQPLASLRSIRVPVPPLEEQRAIAHIVGTLDDKIELNRRMSETLEEMARALFKSWFVNFDPVRAKAEGRDPGLPEPLVDLFPAGLVDSELGEIPAGWRPSKLGSEVTTVLGGTPSRTEPAYWGGDVPWINSGKANEFRVVEPSEFITQEGLASSATKLLPSRTTIIAITGATLGQISLTEIETCANQSIVGVLGTAALPSEFIYFWTKEHVEDLLAWQTGGAQQHVNKNNVNDLPVLCPAEPVIDAYIDLVRPAFDRIGGCCNESRTLAALRDTLLPKLISGELRPENPETFVERAVR